MFKSIVLWRVTRFAYLVAFTLAFILLMVQIFRLGYILFGLPMSSSIPFLALWMAYYGYYFVPDGVLSAVALVLHDLKEKRLIHVIYSFHISPQKIFWVFMIPVGIFFALHLTLSFLIFEEHVSFANRGLVLQYRDRVMENLPQKTFIKLGDVVIYTEKKGENTLENVFLRYKGTQIYASSATYEGMGRFRFSNGSVITMEEGRYLLMQFKDYWLDTEEVFSEDVREKRIMKELKLNLVNSLSMIPLSVLAFLGSLLICRTHTQTYYLIALLILIRQGILFTLKANL